MKLVKILILGLVFAGANVLAADTKPVRVPVVQQPKQVKQKDPHATGTYSWQDCVDDFTSEGGLSLSDAYKKCEKLH